MRKQKALIISLIAIIFVIASAKNRGDSVDKTVNSESNAVHNIQEPEVTKTTQEFSEHDGYSVKEYNGCIAVFKKDSKYPLRTTEISVKTLPAADQKILKNGIFAENNEQLNEILEDYLS